MQIKYCKNIWHTIDIDEKVLDSVLESMNQNWQIQTNETFITSICKETNLIFT